jgi:hypothetical protein
MKAVARRIAKLENQLEPANRPRPRIRLEIRTLGSKLCLEDATCKGTMCSDGSLLEVVDFKNHNEGPDELTDEELNRWLDGFPIQ